MDWRWSRLGTVIFLFIMMLSGQIVMGAGADQVCTEESPQLDSCCEKVEYVYYTPWEEGVDAGLYCLPGSKLAYACPTRPAGHEIYEDQSHYAHKSRYPNEYKREDWRTIMMHMRVILPMTACDYRKVLAFMQNKRYEPKKRAALPRPSAPPMKPSVEIGAEEGAVEGLDLADSLQAEGGESLEEMIGPIDVGSGEFPYFGPVGAYQEPAKFNHVFTGYALLDYSSPTSSYFGDFDGNDSFAYIFGPTYLASYGDSILLAARISVFNYGQEARFYLPFAWIAYFFNDYITFQFGKFVPPFGVYFNHFWNPWIEKSASTPLPRSIYEDFAISEVADIGIEVKGAIPLCSIGPRFKDASFSYDFWIGNGTSEVNSLTPTLPPGRYPIGTISYDTGQGNSPNNNNEFFHGGRLGFNPSLLEGYGISYMRGRWSSDKKTFGAGNKFYFEGAAFDWNINFWRYCVFRGEYFWTQYENSIEEYPWVRQTAYWAQLSFNLGILECFFPNIYCCRPCFWDSTELVFRSDAVWSQPSGRTIIGYDYSGFDKRRFSITLGYYFTQTFTAKVEYAINYGETGLNTTREAITGSDKKTGFAQNVFTFRVAYGW